MTETGTLKRVMKAFDWQLNKKGYIPMSGQIVDASLVPAPKQRNSDDERQAIKDGKWAKEIWPDKPVTRSIGKLFDYAVSQGRVQVVGGDTDPLCLLDSSSASHPHAGLKFLQVV